MKSEDLVLELRKIKEEIISLENRLKYLKNEESNINNLLEFGILFKPKELLRIISYLVSFKTGDIYIPKIESVRPGCLNSNHAIGYLINKDNKKIDVFDFEDKAWSLKGSDNYYMLTFQFLVDNYLVYYKNGVSNNYFEDYSYIKDFISYLAELQINNNKHLTYDEMVEALSDFVKDKPKTKELNINN